MQAYGLKNIIEELGRSIDKKGKGLYVTIGVKKLININLFIQILLCLISGILYSINVHYNILFFVPDLLNVVNVVLLILLKRERHIVIKSRTDYSLIIGEIFLLYTAFS